MNLENIPLYFVGDHHGSYEHIFSIIDHYDIKDCYLFHVGDGGEGFVSKLKQLRIFKQLNESFKSRNIFYKSIRGNHSDPSYFLSPLNDLSHFQLIEDYSTAVYCNQTIQFIGGAISIDRVARVLNASYWEGEAVNLDKNKCQKVDILLTHSAPSWCFPQKFNDLVYQWSYRDAYLLKELTNERLMMDEIFNICQPKLHIYGHFHSSYTENINNCTHKLLNINEFWELKL